MKRMCVWLVMGSMAGSLYAGEWYQGVVTAGSKVWTNTYEVTSQDGEVVGVVSNESEVWTVRNQVSGATTTLNVQSKTLTLVGKVEGNTLRLEGKKQAKEVKKSYSLDGKPLYAVPELSLKSFVVSGEKEVVFFSIRPDDLSGYMMKAIREAEETIDVNGKSLQAIRVRVTLANWMSRFWSVFYWFDREGNFLMYRGVNGGPGTPETVIKRR